MGEAFISAKRERFAQRRDAARRNELDAADLMSLLPDASTTVYRCDMSSDVQPQPSDLVAVAELDVGRVSVLLKNTVVGVVKSADAKRLSLVLSNSPHKMLVAIVATVRARSRTFTIRIATE